MSTGLSKVLEALASQLLNCEFYFKPSYISCVLQQLVKPKGMQ